MSQQTDALGPVLRQILHEEAAAMEVDTTTARTRLDREVEETRTSSRRRYGIAAAAAGIAAAAVTGIVILADPTGDSSAPAPAVNPPPDAAAASLPFLLDVETLERTPLSFDPLPESMPDRTSVYFDVSHEGRLAWGTCCRGRADVMGTADLDATSPEFRTPPPPGNAYVPVWHPDGETMLYQLRDGRGEEFGELVLDDGAEVRRVLRLPEDRAGGWYVAPELSPDGEDVVFHLPRSGRDGSGYDVWSVPVSGGEPERLVPDATFPQWFPDGERLLVTKPFGDGDFFGPRLDIVDADGERRTLVDFGGGVSFPEISPDGTRVLYLAFGTAQVVDVATGDIQRLASADTATWVDDDTVLVNRHD